MADRGGERITGLFFPAAPRVGLFGVHDGKRFAGVLLGCETFVNRVRKILGRRFACSLRHGRGLAGRVSAGGWPDG